MKKTIVSRLVKSEDLNHHGTLFAGRASEWFIEACFISGVQAGLLAENILCYNVHGFKFMEPAERGSIVRFESYITKVGTTSYTVYCRVSVNHRETASCEGYVTFVYVDESGKKRAHGLQMDQPANDEEARRRKEAETLQ